MILEEQMIIVEGKKKVMEHGTLWRIKNIDLPRPREGNKGGKGKDKGSKPEKFDGNFFWCGAYGHVVVDCQKKAPEKPQAPRSPRGPDPKSEGRGQGGTGKKGASLDEWPEGQNDQPSGEKASVEVAGLFTGVVTRHERYSRRDWQAWEKIQRHPQRQWKAHKSGNLSASAVALRWVREST